MMKVSDVLIKAKALIDHPNKWAQGVSFNIDEQGNTSYCSAGAVTYSITHISQSRMCTKAMHLLSAAIPPNERSSVVYYNDHSTHADVMALFDRAIQLAKHDEEQLSKGDNNDDRQGSTLNDLHEEEEEPCLVSV